MATCPTCHTSGANWKHCKACGIYYCFKCKSKEIRGLATNKCPNCGSLKVESKQPS